MKTLTFLVIAASAIIAFYLSQTALAQDHFGLPAESAPYPEFEQHGNLVDLKMVPAGKQTRIYVVGKEAAKIDMNKISLSGKLKNGTNEKIINFRKNQGYFDTDEVLEGESLHVKAKMENIEKDEEFHFNLRKH